MTIKKIFRESIWIYVFVFLSAIAGYLLRVTYARNFTVREYGMFYAVYGFIFLFRPLREFGLGASQMFHMNKSLTKNEYAKAKGIFVVSIVSQVLLSVIVAVGIFMFRNYLAQNFFKDEIAVDIIDVILIYFIIHAVFYNLSNVFGSFQKHFLFQLRDPVSIIAIFLFSLLFLNLGFSTLTMPLAHVFSGILALLIYWIFYKTSLKELNLKAHYSYDTIKEVFTYAFAMSIGSLAWVILSYLHTTLITWIKGVESVGYYNIVTPSVQIIFLLTNPVINLIFPIATNFFNRDMKSSLSALISLIYNNFLILTLPAASIFFIYSTKIIIFIFGAKYAIASPALKIYLLFWIFIFLRQVNLVFLASMGEAKFSTRILWVEVLFNVFAAIIMIWLFDYTGAVIAGGIGAVLITFLTFNFLKKKIAVKIDYTQQLKTLLCGIIFTITAVILERKIFLTIGKFSVVAEGLCVLSLSGIVYIFSLIVLKVVTREKILYVKKMIF